MTWQTRIVGHGEEAPDQLLANPANARVHPRTQQDAMAGILGEVGFVQSVLVNQRTGCLVDGHMRVQIALREGQTTIPVTYVDLSPEEERKVLATFDPLGALASTDYGAYGELVDGLELGSESLAGLVAEKRGEGDAMAAGRADGTGEPGSGSQPGPGDGEHLTDSERAASRGRALVSIEVTPEVKAQLDMLLAGTDGGSEGERLGRLLQCVDADCLS